jgi:hypothetical protein
VKSTPIRCSLPVVRAILDGSKTQDRAIVRGCASRAIVEFTSADPSGFIGFDVNNNPLSCVHSPYGEVGDRLWVKEAFRKTCDNKAWGCVQYKADESIRLMICDNNGEGDPIETKPHKEPLQRVGKKGPPYQSGYLMPQWASRITLEITSVRIERLNDISRGDCMAEGCPLPNIAGETDPQGWFRDFWESKSGFGTGAWDFNPWVWVVEFRVLEKGR